MAERTLEFDSEREFHKLYEEKPGNLKSIEEKLGLILVARGSSLQMCGSSNSIDKCEELFSLLQIGREHGFTPKGADFLRFLDKIASGQSSELEELLSNPLVLNIRKTSIVPRNLSQRHFLDLILKEDLVFGIGPAGTGKTFLAMIVALNSLLKGEVQRIVLARPAVEAGEALGFL